MEKKSVAEKKLRNTCPKKHKKKNYIKRRYKIMMENLIDPN